MRRFLYYFPGVPGVNSTMLAKFGALDRFVASGGKLIGHTITAVQDGPAGPGCVVAIGQQPPAKAGAWMQCDRWWLALEGMPPGPEDLARDLQIRGYPMALGDGNEWMVPLIHRWTDAGHVPAVPCSLRIGSGRIERQIRPEYARADQIASRAFQGFVAGQSLPVAEAFADASALLAVNYRVGVEEVGLLGLLTDEAAIARLLGLSIDTPGINAASVAAGQEGIVYCERELALAEGSD